MKLKIKLDPQQSQLIAQILFSAHTLTGMHYCEILILQEMRLERIGKFQFAEKTQSVSFRMSEALALVSALDATTGQHDSAFLWMAANEIKSMILPKMPSAVFSSK